MLRAAYATTDACILPLSTRYTATLAAEVLVSEPTEPMEIDLEVEEPEGKEIRLPCPSCANVTFHRVVVSARLSEWYRLEGYHQTSWYQVVQCQGCRTLSFRKVTSDNDSFFYDEMKGEHIPVERESLFPPRVNGRRQLVGAYLLPFTVYSIYKETVVSLANDSPILAGIGIRALVEAVCKERKASGRTLEKQIDDLVIQGVLTSDGAEILHSLRLMGNLAAHEAKPHTESEILIGLDVVENLLDTVYLIPRKADSLPKRQSGSSAI